MKYQVTGVVAIAAQSSLLFISFVLNEFGALWIVHMVWSWSIVDHSHGVELEQCGSFTWYGVGAVWIVHMVLHWIQ